MKKAKILMVGLLMGLTLTACGNGDNDTTAKETQSSEPKATSSNGSETDNECPPYENQVVCKVDKISDDDIYLIAIDPTTVSEEVDKNDPKRYLGDFDVDDKLVVSKKSSISYFFVNNSGEIGSGYKKNIEYEPQEGDIIFIQYNDKVKKDESDGIYDMRNEKIEIVLQQYANTLVGTVEDVYTVTNANDTINSAIKMKVTSDSSVFKKGDIVSVVYNRLDNGNKINDDSDSLLKVEKGDNVYFDYGLYEANKCKESLDKGEEAILNPAYLMVGEPDKK